MATANPPSTEDHLQQARVMPQNVVIEFRAPAALHLLPMELLSMILKFIPSASGPHALDITTLSFLARTCKRLSLVLRPILFRNLGDKELSRESIYLLLRTLEENPQLQPLVQSINFLDDLRGEDNYDDDLEITPNPSRCQDQFFLGLINRYIGRFPGGRNPVRPIHTREYPLLLTLFLHLSQARLSRANIKIPDYFWASGTDSITGQKVLNYALEMDFQQIYNGTSLMKLPTLQHLTHLTLDCQHVGETQNQDAVAVILAAAPNLKALNLRKCRQLSIDIVGSLVRACPRLVCFTISGMNDLRQPVYHDYTRFPADCTNLILQQLRSYSSTLEKIHIGRWWYGWFSHGSPRFKDDLISFRGLPNLRVVSVHCWTLYQDKRNTSDALVDMVKDCPKLECLELVEADWGIPPEMVLKALVTFKRFLGKGGSRFPHLRRISLVCWTPDKVRKWASPFLFKSVGVDVVYMDERQWLDNWIRVVETEGKQII